MHIAFISAVYPPEPEPTATMTSELAAAWSKAGNGVTVICPFPNRPAGRFYSAFDLALRRTYRQGAIAVTRVLSWPIGPERKAHDRVLENVSFGLSSAVEVLRTIRPDVVIVESWPIYASLLGVVAGRLRGIPVINYIKDLYPEAAVAAGVLKEGSIATRLVCAVDRQICSAASMNVVISEGMRDHMVKSRRLPGTRFSVVRDWLDLEKIAPVEGPLTWRREVGIPDDDFVGMVAGTLGLASGIDIMVDVARLLKDERGTRIVCIGEGVLKQKMLDASKQLGLDNLTILPFQPRERVPEVQSSADIMILTTSPRMGTSSVPNKLITYLAVGKPVLCAVPAGSEIARLVGEQQIGGVVEPGSPEALARGLKELRGKGRTALREMGARARRVALERYSLQAALRAFDAVLAEIGLPSASAAS